MSDAKTSPGARGGYIASSEEPPDFRSVRALLEWHFAQRRLHGQDIEGGGGHATAYTLDARKAKHIGTSKCLAGLTDEQVRLLEVRFGNRAPQEAIADRLGKSAETVARRIDSALSRVRRRGRELGMLP